MKIVVAPDSFKNNMRSTEVCDIIVRAITETLPACEVRAFPMADGGEGTVDAAVAATGGSYGTVEVQGPLGEPAEARYGLLPNGTGVMEMASASGIELIPAASLNPMETSTYGTGQLLAHLLDVGCPRVVIGLGGSATVDGGTGLAQALGCRFMDRDGVEILERGGKILERIGAVDRSGMDGRLQQVQIDAACDVRNLLVGSEGAARIFGPQKGASPEQVERLDRGLSNLLQCLGVESCAGDGAAGGLGFGLRLFCGARIVSGAQLLAEVAGLPEALEGADLLITGEGRTDGQTASGKLCSVLASMARERGVRTLLVSGALEGCETLTPDPFDYAFSISAGHTSLEACIAHAREDLDGVIRNVMRLLGSTATE